MSQWSDYAYLSAINAGYSPDAAHAVQAIVLGEGWGGPGGRIGDNGHSYGPLQFFDAGQLALFASWLKGQHAIPATGSLQDAGMFAENNPLTAIDWAIGPGGYLGRALKGASSAGQTALGYLRALFNVQNANGDFGHYSQYIAAPAPTGTIGPGGSIVSPPIGPPAPSIGPPIPQGTCPTPTSVGTWGLGAFGLGIPNLGDVLGNWWSGI